MNKHFVGIDISKAFFDALVEVNGRIRHHKFPNSEKGVTELLAWCEKWSVTNAHFCMEATGAFWIAPAKLLHAEGCDVSVVNPACIKRFAQSELKRTKQTRLTQA